MLQIISISILSFLLISWLYAVVLSHNIKIERNTENLKLACREKAEVTFTIQNYSPLTAHIFYYMDDIPYFHIYNDENKGASELRAHEIKKISYKVSSHERGLFHAGPVKIRTSDPAGLFLIEKEIPCPLEITVRPARIKLITELMPGFPQGNLKIQNPCYEDITMRRSIREYKNGDELKRINWRASAKFGATSSQTLRLFTNQYEDSYDAPFFVFLNLGSEDYELRASSYYTEKAIEIAASIVEYSRFKRQRCGFAAFAEGFPYLAPHHNQADAILDILSVIKTTEGKLEYNPEQKFMHQLPTGTLFFKIGPNEVQTYFSKVESNMENINTTNTGILKKNGKQSN